MTTMTNKILRQVLQPWRILALVILAFGLVATIRRFALGLGASTNLTDEFPWGLWVSFDVLCGVGLAAGGFTISAMVYIFRMEKYRPLARPAVMTAFIGYLLVVGGLIYDLGLPWRLWHAIIHWNHHSVMFEVAWCVMLYTSVLAAEVSAMVFERLKMARAAHIAHMFTLPLTIAAVCLSMLHQSSLGTVFLLVPGRLHELWYSPLLPFLYFASAIGVGLSMAIVESTLSARAFRRCVEAKVLQGVARVAVWIYAIYVSLRIGDLIVRDQLHHVLHFDRAAWFFIVEISVGFVIPLVLYMIPKVRRNTHWLYHAAQMAVFGFIVNRMNVGITGFEVVEGVSYVPSWEEMAVTLSLVTVGVIAFNLAGRFLPVFEAEPEDELAKEVFAARQREREAQRAGGAIPRGAVPSVGTNDPPDGSTI
jgi:Ni/Fe-hydrogenase subunit HybB-like protein